MQCVSAWSKHVAERGAAWGRGSIAVGAVVFDAAWIEVAMEVIPQPPVAPCKCGYNVPLTELVCAECGDYAGFPNRRYADRAVERASLAKRVRSARVSARARNLSKEVRRFWRAVQTSNAVVSKSLDGLDTFVNKGSGLMATYYAEVRGAGTRLPENNGYDQVREPNDAKVSPHFHDKLIFGALSLDGMGVPWYGEYSISFDSEKIASRATVFEENGISFNRRHAIVGTKMVPPGYRAEWEHRGSLAMAKLGARITEDVSDQTLAAALLPREKVAGETDFIEVHIYAPLASSAIAQVSGKVPDDDYDKLLLQRTIGKLRKLGASWREIA